MRDPIKQHRTNQLDRAGTKELLTRFINQIDAGDHDSTTDVSHLHFNALNSNALLSVLQSALAHLAAPPIVQVRVREHVDPSEHGFRNRQPRPGMYGFIRDFSNAHGLCFEVRHEDGTTCWYDASELEPDACALHDAFAEAKNKRGIAFPLKG